MINYTTLPIEITTNPQIRKDRVGRDEKTGKTIRKEVIGVVASRGPVSAWGEDEARAKENLAQKIRAEAPAGHGVFAFRDTSGLRDLLAEERAMRSARHNIATASGLAMTAAARKKSAA